MGSSAAPGELESIRGFVNTVEIEDGRDPNAGPDGLEAWCAARGTALTGPEDASLLRGFREALRAALEANHSDAGRAAGWQSLEPYAARASYGLCIAQDGRLQLIARGDGAQALIAELLAVVYDAIRDGTWPRLKACRKQTCRWAFYDRSKNGSGAWCSMAVCGNRVKAQRRRLSRKNAPEK